MPDVNMAAHENAAADVSLSLAGDRANHRLRLWLLFAAHIVLGLLFSIWAAAHGPFPSLLGLLLAISLVGINLTQTSLLGFWAVFSPVTWWMRLAGLLAGTVYLPFVLNFGTHRERIIWLPVLATGCIAAGFGVIRWRYAELRHFPQQAPPTDHEGVQFSIRGLMIFTLIVAVTMVGLKFLRDNIPVNSLHFTAGFWSLCFAVIGLAAVWAALSLARPILRTLLVLLLSVALGSLYFGMMFLLQTVVLIASLLVVRSCGYRLVRKPEPKVALLD